MIEESGKDIKDYLDAFRRRRKAIILIAMAIFAIGVVTALVWPPTYQSSATILIEEQEIPPELVRSTVTSYAAQRIQTISQRVMTRQNLMEIVERYGLYEDDRKTKTTEEIIQQMREDIGIDMISAEVVDPRTGRPTAATIAFQVSFKGENPAKVQKVTSELTSLYLQENVKARTSRALETYEFLSDEAERLNQRISELDAQLAAFKKEHVHALPELREVNLAALERTERELNDVRTQIQSQEERRIFLQGQLQLVEPYGDDVTMSPAARLKALRTQYASLLGTYSPDHPDVLKIKREIEGLERETGLVDDRTAQLEQLARLRTELATLQKKYSDEHPDVVRLKKSIESVESSLSDDTNPAPKTTRSPDNPAYVNLLSQLQSVEASIRNLRIKRSELQEKLKEYEARLVETSQVESEYRALTREYENAVAKYRELKAKQMEAQVGQQLETERKGERFTLIDPAALPEEPISPNRPAIIFLSLVFAIGGGIGYAAVAESLDSSVRGARGVTQALNVAPLAVIPYLANEEEVSRGRRRRWAGATAVVGIAVLAVLAVHFFVTPLDVLWFRALRKATLLAGG